MAQRWTTRQVSSRFGKFSGEVVATWLIDADGPDRTMRLEADFSYTSPAGIQWPAPKGRLIDGASIPSVFWGPLIGSPYTGDFRRASVVHDVACEDKPYTSDDAHRMLYDAMRCDGTVEWLAKEIYAAVKMFGPQWGLKQRPLPLTHDNLLLYYDLVHSVAIRSNLGTLDAAINRARKLSMSKTRRKRTVHRAYS